MITLPHRSKEQRASHAAATTMKQKSQCHNPTKQRANGESCGDLSAKPTEPKDPANSANVSLHPIFPHPTLPQRIRDGQQT